MRLGLSLSFGRRRLAVETGGGGGDTDPPPAAEPDRLRVHTYWDATTWTPTSDGADVRECWGGGGGGTTATGGGGGGAYARQTSTHTADVGVSVSPGAAGTAGGGSGGDSSIGSGCIANGAAGNIGGQAASSTGDVTRSGANGATGTGNANGGGCAGSGGPADGATGGPPDGGCGAGGNSNNGAKHPGGGGRSSNTNQYVGAEGLCRASYYEPGDPDLPTPVSVTSQQSNGTEHIVVIPPGYGDADDATDTIYYFTSSDGAPTIGIDGATSVAALDSGGAVKLQVFKAVAASASDTITTSVSESLGVLCMRVRHVTSESAETLAGSGSNADPPSLDMGSSAPTMFLTALALDSSTTNGDVTGAPPSGYTDSVLIPAASPGTGVVTYVAWRYATAQTEDPGAFSNQTGDHVTLTMGVRR